MRRRMKMSRVSFSSFSCRRIQTESDSFWSLFPPSEGLTQSLSLSLFLSDPLPLFSSFGGWGRLYERSIFFIHSQLKLQVITSRLQNDSCLSLVLTWLESREPFFSFSFPSSFTFIPLNESVMTSSSIHASYVQRVILCSLEGICQSRDDSSLSCPRHDHRQDQSHHYL